MVPAIAKKQQLAKLLTSARDWYKQHPDEAEKLTSQHRLATVATPEAAAWTAVTRILLNLDEFLTRE